MEGNLIIVESPHKAGQIQSYLGKENFTVVSSKGHVSDLVEKGMGIDIENGFEPQYVITPGQKALVSQLKKLAEKAGTVWLASDPDREGEAIAWHLARVLELDPAKTQRITYNEVTKAAVQEALKHPRGIDMNLVNAQQARRVLDRLVGFELSPILWRKIKSGLSAGRVQSVTLRLVVDREREISAFKPEAYYSVTGLFMYSGVKISAALDRRFQTREETEKFLNDLIGATFSVAGVDKKEGTRKPAAPFTTSTLQQEAARKLHFSSSKTMQVAQTLYEKGLITYMRTDSTNLSSLALGTAKQFIVENFGEKYSHSRNYHTKSKGAQEAHEAIRPTFVSNTQINGTADEQKLYDLIWKRTLASQMADASVLNTTIHIASDKRSELFNAQSTEILFDGFLKLYTEGVDDSESDTDEAAVLPPVSKGDAMDCISVAADCKFTQAPWRYSEQTLIKKMEEIGIGRPSTYAPTITNLTRNRGYIVTADKPGTKTEVTNFILKDGTVTSARKQETVGAEKRKLIPSDVGIMVSDYLLANFPDIMDYDFTAKVEEDFDKISNGELQWKEVIGNFYAPFHTKVDAAIKSREFSHVEREIGTDPSDGKKIIAKFGQYGAYLQKGEGSERSFASLPGGMLIENVTLEEAVKLFCLPRTVGRYKDIDIIATKGRFGPYLKYGELNVKLPRGKDPLSIGEEECISLIDAAAGKAASGGVIAEFEKSGIKILDGRYGPYIKQGTNNFKIPSGSEPSQLTEQDCLDIIGSSQPSAKGKKRFFRKK